MTEIETRDDRPTLCVGRIKFVRADNIILTADPKKFSFTSIDAMRATPREKKASARARNIVTTSLAAPF